MPGAAFSPVVYQTDMKALASQEPGKEWVSWWQERVVFLLIADGPQIPEEQKASHVKVRRKKKERNRKKRSYWDFLPLLCNPAQVTEPL